MSYAQAFATLRAIAGSPQMRCIKPRSEWTIPAGYTWSASANRYVDTNGIPWAPSATSLPYDTVDILPPQGAELFELTAGGMVDSGNKAARILPASLATVEAAAFVLLDGLEYRVTECTPNVSGNPTGYTVRMVKR